jgi:hypothetical protein
MNKIVAIMCLSSLFIALTGCGDGSEQSYGASAKCNGGTLLYSNTDGGACSKHDGLTKKYGSNHGNINFAMASSSVSLAPDINGIWSGSCKLVKQDGTFSAGTASITIVGGKIVKAAFESLPISIVTLENATISGDIVLKPGKEMTASLDVIYMDTVSEIANLQADLLKQ